MLSPSRGRDKLARRLGASGTKLQRVLMTLPWWALQAATERGSLSRSYSGEFGGRRSGAAAAPLFFFIAATDRRLLLGAVAAIRLGVARSTPSGVWRGGGVGSRCRRGIVGQSCGCTCQRETCAGDHCEKQFAIHDFLHETNQHTPRERFFFEESVSQRDK